MFGIYLTCLFENPAVSVGVVSRLIGSAMNLTAPLKDFVQIGWTVPVAFERFLPLTNLGPLNPALTIVSSVSSLLL